MHSRAERSKNGAHILQAFHRGTRGQCRCRLGLSLDQTPLQMSQVRVLLVDAAVVILETQTAGSNAITLIPSSLLPPLPLSTHQTTRACILSTDVTINHRTALPPWSSCVPPPTTMMMMHPFSRQPTPVPPPRPFRFLCSPSSGCLRCSGVQVGSRSLSQRALHRPSPEAISGKK
jgi:hypothetical protein